MATAAPVRVTVRGRTLLLTNLAKLYWPEDGLTKAHLIQYYLQIAPYLLPYLKDRPLVLTRYPDGIHGGGFYQKDAPEGTPEWIPTWPVETSDGRLLRFMLIQELAALVYAANLGAIELHPWLSRWESPDRPDWAVIDLDPAEGARPEDVLTVARAVRRILSAVGIAGWPKLSGREGIHIYCPCLPDHTYRETASFCEEVGRVLLQLLPGQVTLERAVARRTGKVYIDYLQNRRGQTIAAVYAPRPLPGAPVSAPVTWDELEGDPPLFTIQTIAARLAACGDLLAPILTFRQDLRPATELLRRMAGAPRILPP